MKQILLIINSGSRQGEQNRELILEEFKKQQVEVIYDENITPNRYTDYILKYSDQVDAVVVGGGDGTVSLALEGIIKSGQKLGVLPLGTANNLARNLNVPNSLPEAIQVLIKGFTKKIDVATVNDQYFLNVVGLGLSAQINHGIRKDAKKYFGVLAYIYYAIKIARKLQPMSVSLITAAGRETFKTLQLTVCNGRFYGSSFVAEEQASIQDGMLDVICTPPQSWLKGFKIIPALVKGQHTKLEEIKSYKWSEFRLETKRPVSLDVDGDVRTKTPADFKILEKKLEVFAVNQLEGQ